MRATAGVPLYIRRMLDGTRVRHERMLDDWRSRDVEPYLKAERPLQVLDLANGKLRPQSMLLAAAGHRVYGIDLVNRPGRVWVDRAYSIARGWYRARSGLIGKGRPLLVCGDVTALPFSDGRFSLVTSVAAFEHFLDVPTVLDEVYRVLRPGGIVWACIHLFTSPSGGHNIGYTDIPLTTLPRGVEPWDHLRKRRLPFYVPLNEWRRDQYVRAFATRFQVIRHYCAIREGETLLTPEVRASIPGYEPDELTAAAYVIVATKDPHASA